MSDTNARKSKIEDCIYMILCCIVFALWGVLLALGVWTMTIEKTFQGAYRISALVNGYLVTRQYMGYTKREAVQAFKQELSHKWHCSVQGSKVESCAVQRHYNAHSVAWLSQVFL